MMTFSLRGPSRISLTTLHKAKGLEWDLVYIVGVDGDWFPYDLDDHFRGEYEFLRRRSGRRGTR